MAGTGLRRVTARELAADGCLVVPDLPEVITRAIGAVGGRP